MTQKNMALAKPLDTAPKDHTMIWLLVDYSDEGRNPLEDEILGWTIGFNGEEHTGISQWQFTGWNWQQDCFTEGFGKVVGWYPLTRPNAIPLPTDAELLADFRRQVKNETLAEIMDAATIPRFAGGGLRDLVEHVRAQESDHDPLAEAMKLPEVDIARVNQLERAVVAAAMVGQIIGFLGDDDARIAAFRTECGPELISKARAALAPFTAAKETKL